MTFTMHTRPVSERRMLRTTTHYVVGVGAHVVGWHPVKRRVGRYTRAGRVVRYTHHFVEVFGLGSCTEATRKRRSLLASEGVATPQPLVALRIELCFDVIFNFLLGFLLVLLHLHALLCKLFLSLYS